MDEQALAACMAYVDLNPVRAKLATTPEDSDYTAIQRRAKQAERATQPNHPQQQFTALLPFVGNPRCGMPKGLPFLLTDYLELVDWTGRILRDDKRGAIPQHLPPMLERLGITPSHWCYLAGRFESRFKGLVGSAQRMKSVSESLGRCWVHGIREASRVFSSG